MSQAQNEQDLQQLEISIEAARLAVKRRDTMARLQDNKDFKEIFGEGYLKLDAIRSVHLLADPQADAEHVQKAIKNQIIGIGEFAQYIRSIFVMGAKMDAELSRDLETEAGILEEGAVN